MTEEIRALWRVDPSDGVLHAWRHVIDRGVWVAACGWTAADGSVLTDPVDGIDRCKRCKAALSLEWLLQHGAELADRQDAVRTAMRGDLRDELRPPP